MEERSPAVIVNTHDDGWSAAPVGEGERYKNGEQASEWADEGFDLEEESEVGSRRQVLHMYADKESMDGDGPTMYTPVLPATVAPRQRAVRGQRAAVDINSTYALVHYHQVKGDTLWGVSLEIQSPILKAQLSSIFENYPDVDTNIPTLLFEAPFLPLVHRWDRLLRLGEEEPDETRKAVLSLLRDTLANDAVFQAGLKTLRQVEGTGYINYSNILVAMAPGDVILESKNGVVTAGILQSADKEAGNYGNYCALEVDVVDWDGDKYGYRKVNWSIPEFRGFRQITKLGCFPLRLHPAGTSIEAALLRRGKKFESLCGRHFMQYSGLVAMEGRYPGPTPMHMVRTFISPTTPSKTFPDSFVFSSYRSGSW
jgi:hypothetical protein